MSEQKYKGISRAALRDADMTEHIVQTARIDKLVNEIINEEKEESFFEGAYNLLIDAFNLSETEIESKDYKSLVDEVKNKNFKV